MKGLRTTAVTILGCSCTPNLVALLSNQHVNQSRYVNGQTACYCAAPLQIGGYKQQLFATSLWRHTDACRAPVPPPLPRHQAVLRAAAVLCVILIAHGRSHYVPSGGKHSALPFYLFVWQAAVLVLLRRCPHGKWSWFSQFIQQNTGTPRHAAVCQFIVHYHSAIQHSAVWPTDSAVKYDVHEQTVSALALTAVPVHQLQLLYQCKSSNCCTSSLALTAVPVH